MSVTQTASSEATAYAMSDFARDEKGADVSMNSVDTSQRPNMGRRKTSNNPTQGALEAQTSGYHDEDGLTKIGNWIYRIHSSSILTRYALYIIPVGALLAVPIVLTASVYKEKSKIEHPLLLGLFIWIEMLWVMLWVAKLIAMCVPPVFQALCGIISSGIRKYTTVLSSLEIPISLFIWTIGAWGSSRVITVFDNNLCEDLRVKNLLLSKDDQIPVPCDGWPHTLERVFLAGIVVAAIFLGEKTIVQLISIDYHRKQYDAKIKESKKVIWLLDLLYDASRTLFPEFCKEFEEEDGAIQGNNVAFTSKGIHTKVLYDMGRARDKVTAAFGAMVTDISGKTMFNSTAAHSIVIEALETEHASKALARRLWLSFVAEGREELYKQDLIEVLGYQRADEVEEIFSALDRDGNGDVSLDEMTMLVVRIGQDRKNRAKSMHDISQAISVLDRLLCAVVLVAIAFVYAAFFSPDFSNKLTTLWTTFTGLAFAIGGTVTEFLACCIFLFIKHPYDVGDRVDINDVQLIVEHVSLMYSVFRRIDSNKTVQIPHNIANTLWIENISRSKAMKERLTLSVAATTSNEDILALRSELQNFVTADENRRDFKPEFDIELVSVGNMQKLDLQVEIRHKSNWSNELVRSTRRNKFMCALLAAMRRIPIDPPGGSGLPLGDPGNPTYSVSVSDIEASEARTQHAKEVDSARLFPKSGGASSFLPDAMSTALENPAQAMIAGITGRRGSVLAGARRSADSLRISQESMSRSGYSQPSVREKMV